MVNDLKELEGFRYWSGHSASASECTSGCTADSGGDQEDGGGDCNSDGTSDDTEG